MSKEFLGKPAPPGYVAGLGRGATGFMTRPDLGSGKDVALTTPGSRFNSDRSTIILREEDEDRMNQYENEEGLLAPSGAYGAEDEEADQIFAAIDAKMAERRQRQKAKAEMAANLRKRPGSSNDSDSVQGVFSDIKKELAKVSMEEWANIPEAGDHRTKRVKKSEDASKERYTPLPDSIIVGGARESSASMSNHVGDGDELDSFDFVKIQEARERVLGTRLDQAITGSASTSVDAEDYLAGLGASQKARMEVGDVKRARLMLQSAVQTNPHSAQAWIAAVRLEEAALELRQARELVKKACAACPDSEDVWLEALRLLPKEQSLEIMSNALENVPASGRLWSKAAALESDLGRKRRLLQRGLESCPSSSELWKELVELETDEADAKALLSRAVEHCPRDIDLWLALARLEDHEGARKVINQARQANPKNPEIWLAAARLEEAYDNFGLVEKIIIRAYDDLQLDSENWFDLTIQCESSGDMHTAQAIVAVAFKAIEEPALLSNAEQAETKESFGVAKAFISLLPTKDASVWLRLVELDRKANGEILSTLEQAVTSCPNSEDLWLAYLKNKLECKDETGASEILDRAYKAIPSSEAVWLAAVKLHLSHGNRVEAQRLLSLAREKFVSLERIWRWSARLAPSPEDSKRLLIEGLDRFPQSSKMFLELARLEQGNHQITRGIFEKAMTNCPTSPQVWIAAAQFEESLTNHSPAAIASARVLLEKGRGRCLGSEELWLNSVQLEFRAQQPTMAKSLLSKALQIFPKSGLLWSEAIMREPRPLRKGKATAALSQVGQDSLVYLTIAKLMWADRKLEPAKEHFERAIALDSTSADIWAWYSLFARQHLGTEEAKSILERALQNGVPRKGQLWKPFRQMHRESFEQDPRLLFLSFIDTLQPPL